MNEAPFSLSDILHEKEISLYDYDCRRYPDPYPLYEKLADYLGVDTHQLLLTPGSDQAIRLAFELMVSSCSEVIFLEPTFAMIDVFCTQFRVTRKVIPFSQSLTLDTNKLLESINEETRFVVIADPNNPIGTIIDLAVLTNVAESCSRVGALFLLDLAYFPYGEFNGIQLLKNHENIVIIRTFSKAWGLAGIRAGYMVALPDLIELLRKVKPSHELATYSIEAAMIALDHPKIVDLNISQVTKWKQRFANVKRDGLEYLDNHANFIMFRAENLLRDILFKQFHN